MAGGSYRKDRFLPVAAVRDPARVISDYYPIWLEPPMTQCGACSKWGDMCICPDFEEEEFDDQEARHEDA